MLRARFIEEVAQLMDVDVLMEDTPAYRFIGQVFDNCVKLDETPTRRDHVHIPNEIIAVVAAVAESGIAGVEPASG